MARWSEIEAEAPELTELARRYFDASKHKTLATLRRDGSPRISGTEVEFRDGDMWLGSMWRAVKALDLRRDPRFALHSPSADPDEWTGDAKLSGTAHEVDDAPPRTHLFRCDITELSVVRLNDTRDRLVIESWHPGRGVTRRER